MLEAIYSGKEHEEVITVNTHTHNDDCTLCATRQCAKGLLRVSSGRVCEYSQKALVVVRILLAWQLTRIEVNSLYTFFLE